MKRIFQRRFSLIEVAGFLAFVMAGAAFYVHAANTVPHPFTAESKASEMNENFKDPADLFDTADQLRNRFFNRTPCRGNTANDIMVRVGPLCVDKYEASVWSNPDGTGTQYGGTAYYFNLTPYPEGFPENGNWTTPVYAASKAGVFPSTNLTWFQAQQACALSGKRLLTNAEWQMAASGTPDPGIEDDGATTCDVIGPFVSKTGSRTACVSNWGVKDMVGNVHEWVADWIQGSDGNGVFGSWNPHAVSISSATYGNDGVLGINEAYPYTDHFPSAIHRGGSWLWGKGAGVFALVADQAPSFLDEPLGFRCAR